MDIHLYVHQAESHDKLDQIINLLKDSKKRELTMSVELDNLTAKVTANTAVDQSALTLIQGITARIDAAIAAAQANGATPEVLAKLVALSTELGSSSDALAAAVAANTPADVPPTPTSHRTSR